MALSRCHMRKVEGREVCGSNRAANHSKLPGERQCTSCHCMVKLDWQSVDSQARCRCMAGQMDGELKKEQIERIFPMTIHPVDRAAACRIPGKNIWSGLVLSS
eukprot:756424-Pelagomonas_calceolata.AAC.6